MLLDEAKGAAGNPWGISFTRMMDMSNDSGLFRTARQLADSGAVRLGADWMSPDGTRMVPLYEANLVDHFDHRWSNAESDDGGKDLQAEGHRRSDAFVAPRYWVPSNEIDARLAAVGWHRQWLMGFRGITRATDERSFIATVIPRSGVGTVTGHGTLKNPRSVRVSLPPR